MPVIGFQVLLDVDDEQTQPAMRDRQRIAFFINQGVSGVLDQRGVFIRGTQVSFMGENVPKDPPKDGGADKDKEGTPKPTPGPVKAPGEEKAAPAA